MAALPSEEYWKRRTLGDMKRRANLTEDFVAKTLAPLYKECLDEITEEMKKFYEKYAKAGLISKTEAKKRIGQASFEGIDWEALVNQAAETGDAELLELVRTLSVKGQITRLELLDLEISSALSKLYDAEQVDIHGYLTDTYIDGYYHSIYNMQSYFGFATSFTALPAAAIYSAVTQPWSGNDFSSIIWGHRSKLSEDLRSTITKAIIKGHSIERTSKSMAKDMGVSLSDAKRLVRTESNYAHNQATLKAYETYAGIKRYQFLATLDFRTSEICQELDGKVFETKDQAVGKNYPPMHPNCRSTTVPYFDGQAVGERAARGSDGKTYYVPADMTYEQWFDSLPPEEQAALKLERKKAANRYKDEQQFGRYKDVLGNDAPKSIKKFTELKYEKPEEYALLKEKYSFKNRLQNDKVNLNVRKLKQQEHIFDTERFKHRVELSKEQEAPLPSYFVSDEDVQSLINNYVGKGQIVFRGADTSPREYVDTDRIVGKYYDIDRKEYLDTNRIAIHYSNKGTHAYPAKSDNKPKK